ncbi:PREDICTED: WD repeat-containing protein 43 [Cyprinodon variegatus]|uniref:WD repeat-containing protein 43 n=1 Tax=Cyprinodon variegatus TaxID=28743 RepID=UPI0007426F71|nr:PREDICTED: WD repeat-containing protein 43 [Cyprinodon variegatus]
MAAGDGSLPQQLPCVFSPKSRQYLAVCAQDGRLRVWNTDSKTLQQEFVPSAHLSATCTCIAWGPCRTVKEGPQRKKRKSEAAQVEEKADLLAMGTAAGTVLIYSTAKGALHCTLDGAHSGGVNCVHWHPEDSLLYSGSDDTNIVEWDLQSGKTRSKWKADRAAVTSLSVSPDGKLLLSAGHVIKMWDLETKEVYRKFTGHSTAVTTLRFATSRPPDSNGLYFLSGAAHDRLLSVCQSLNSTAVSSSLIHEFASLVDLNVFKGQFNTVKPNQSPFFPKLCSVSVYHPVFLLPLQEINTAERHVCLTRDVKTSLSLSMETTASKVKTPVINAKSKVLVPGLPGHTAPLTAAQQGTEKRKKDSDNKEMSIAERLGEIDLEAVSSQKGASRAAASLQTDNFAILLMQGLESNDDDILNKVFQTRKDVLIKKTVARLPLSAVIPLVEELTKRLQGHPLTACLMVRWLKAVLMHHTSYLASLPDLVAQLGVLYHMIESRVKMFHKLTKLHGKLHLLTTQVAANDSSNAVSEVDHTAKLVYEEESSDEDDASVDEALPDEGSDHWDEEEAMQDDEDDDPDRREEAKANGEEDMEHENESEEE